MLCDKFSMLPILPAHCPAKASDRYKGKAIAVNLGIETESTATATADADAADADINSGSDTIGADDTSATAHNGVGADQDDDERIDNTEDHGGVSEGDGGNSRYGDLSVNVRVFRTGDLGRVQWQRQEGSCDREGCEGCGGWQNTGKGRTKDAGMGHDREAACVPLRVPVLHHRGRVAGDTQVCCMLLRYVPFLLYVYTVYATHVIGLRMRLCKRMRACVLVYR